MPNFLDPASFQCVDVAFPNIFDALLVCMFLSEEGYTGHEDDNNESTAGCWYGLSWSCIHRDIPRYWRPAAREIRREYFSAWRRWIVTLGRDNRFYTDQFVYFWIAALNRVPAVSFSRAAQRLIDDGCIRTVEEDGVHMYYPLPRMAHRISAAIEESN